MHSMNSAMIFNLLLNSLIWVFLLDLSGFIPEIEAILSRRLFHNRLSVNIPKPFNCSLCMSFWTGLIYVLIVQPSLASIALVCLFSYLTTIEGSAIRLIRDLIECIIGKIGSKLN